MNLAHALAILAVAWSCAFVIAHHDWDEVAYAAVAISYDTRDPVAVHERAYAALRQVVPPATYRTLTADTPYRTTVATDAGAFHEQLSFYKARVLHCGAIYLLTRIGLNAVRAAFVVSAIAYAALALILAAWLRRSTTPAKANAIALILCVAFPFTAVARVATPDALHALVLCTAAYLFDTTGSRRALFGMLLVALLVRYDAVTLGLLFAAYFFLVDRRDPWKTRALHFAATAAPIAGLAALVARAGGAYGWPVVFHHTFVESLPHPAGAAVSVRPAEYLRALAACLSTSVPASGALYYALLLAVGAARYVKRQARIDLAAPIVALPAVFLADIVARLLLFPAFWDRFFTAHYAVITVAAVRMILHPPGEAAARGAADRAVPWIEEERLSA